MRDKKLSCTRILKLFGAEIFLVTLARLFDHFLQNPKRGKNAQSSLHLEDLLILDL